MFCTDEHRLGLKPVLRSVWAPKGERPTALGHHRFQWLYVTAFVGPATGETVWYLTDTVSKPLFADLLDAFARAVGAGPQKRVVLLLDNAGWHTLPNLAVPDGLKLVYLPRLLPRTAPCGAFPNLLRRSWAQASSARRDALDAGGRTRRQHLRPQPGQAHPHHHRAVLQPFHPTTRDQLPHQLRLVAQKSSPALISRTSYEVEVAVHVLNRMLDLGRPNSIRIA